LPGRGRRRCNERPLSMLQVSARLAIGCPFPHAGFSPAQPSPILYLDRYLTYLLPREGMSLPYQVSKFPSELVISFFKCSNITYHQTLKNEFPKSETAPDVIVQASNRELQIRQEIKIKVKVEVRASCRACSPQPPHLGAPSTARERCTITVSSFVQ
jgi:hypothetical protein